ncbi:ABC transporter substrate-binding protein [Evansella cellulosilytica]|uniref:Extracellular solute-binding protein family 1 n=1 Tax=Evansella cellulosilytica (strain ATCC 21833 / DSM 2522 / FERM P-1141 / JCM 9156 / N-4) TaxID=649639 RepID=E6TU04_EVAC2|nr:ABC transporter substrate-binding protein [Evansella cellulosilytica]ADU32035.1 extracellular solute-binding protein family 1 [Evansella cellulosilytica DSM 2522]
MKKNIYSFLLCLMMVFVLAACGNTSEGASSNEADGSNDQSSSSDVETSSESSDAIEIEFMHMHGGDIVERLVEQYHEAQDEVRVKTTFVEGSYEGIVEQVQMRATTGSLPDVITNGHVYTRFAIDTLPVISLQSFMDEENYDTSDFFPSMLTLGQSDDGEQYGMPFAVSTPVVYFNEDHFEEVGLDPNNPPQTWDELREAAEKLTFDDRYGIYFDYQITGNWLYQAMVETAGGQMMEEDLSGVAFDTDAGRKALQYWVDLVNEDKSMPNIDRTQASQSFLSGNTSMFVTTTASLTSFRTQSDFEVGTAVFPTVDGLPRVVPAGGNNLFMLSVEPEKQAATWDFMKFAASAEGTTFIAQEIGYMVTRQSPLDEASLMGDFLEEVPAAKVTYDQVDEMVPWYNFPGSAGSRVYQIVQDNIQAALLQQKTVDEAITDAAKQANELLN